MTLNEQQFDKQRWMPESITALEHLAAIPTYSDVSGFAPDHTTSREEHAHHLEKARKYHAENIKPWEDHTMALMEKERIPQHPKLRQQYDKGMISSSEYAQHLLLSLSHS